MVQGLIELPNELKVVIAGLVLAGVRALLGRWFPDAALSEIAVAVTAALLIAIQAGLGMIPVEFEAVAVAILQLVVVLLGLVLAGNGYRKARVNGFLR